MVIDCSLDLTIWICTIAPQAWLLIIWDSVSIVYVVVFSASLSNSSIVDIDVKQWRNTIRLFPVEWKDGCFARNSSLCCICLYILVGSVVEAIVIFTKWFVLTTFWVISFSFFFRSSSIYLFNDICLHLYNDFSSFISTCFVSSLFVIVFSFLSFDVKCVIVPWIHGVRYFDRYFALRT